MRLSILIFIFLLLFNGFGLVIQDYGIDDHLGINAETGDGGALNEAASDARDVNTGEPTGQTLLGYYNNLLNTLKGVFVGLQPGMQLLVNVAPAGIAEDLIIWCGSILPIIMMVDVLYFARGGGL